ncbi:MAG: hypothetical protein V4641_05685 [Pseudomonadota bacterium]
MAKLSKSSRDQLTSSEFLGPGRSFPANDLNHAQKAAQLAPRSLAAGNISQSTEQSIIRKAHAKIRQFKKRGT